MLYGVTLNVYVYPPSEEVRDVGGSTDDTLKSEAGPAVGPDDPLTVILQEMAFKIRAGLIFVHVSTDEVVGIPYTVYMSAPLLIGVPPIKTLIAYNVTRRLEDIEVGVAVNVNVDPPSVVLGVIGAALEDDILKSDASPVVAPAGLLHVIVHTIGTATRATLAAAKQVNVDAAVGIAETQYAPRYPVGQL